jgi:hypothetical protein
VLLSGRAFEELFTNFQHTAWRLEVRESYYERDALAQFLEHGPAAVNLAFMEDWWALIRSHAAAGRRVERARVVSEPHSDYTRFGLWLAERTVAAGEDIRYLSRPLAHQLGLPEEDYWLFDSKRLFIVHYDTQDNLLGAEPITDPQVIVSANAWRDAAWHYAVPRSDYASRHGLVSIL